ncbi:aspartate 1-decarboxylase [Candidatus Fermentibacteria bacterium]|nr:aspartate 1-decarboxylase [Candidatus Fermentibacteria bacterium]
MFRCFLTAKLHRLVITECDLDYVGSITLDRDLLELSGILLDERVLVADLRSGARFETYVMEGEPGSGTVCINGAAARLVDRGDRIIVMQFSWIDTAVEVSPGARVVVANDENLEPRLLQ